MAQKQASARVLVDAIDEADQLPYLNEPLAGLPPILANHPKELEPALRKLAAFQPKKASPRRKSPVPADLGVAPAQGVQKPAHRSKSGEGQARLDKEAARHNKTEANADSFVKRLKAKAKKRNAAAGLSRMVRGMSLGALPKGSNRKEAEAKKLKELQDNAATSTSSAWRRGRRGRTPTSPSGRRRRSAARSPRSRQTARIPAGAIRHPSAPVC